MLNRATTLPALPNYAALPQPTLQAVVPDEFIHRPNRKPNGRQDIASQLHSQKPGISAFMKCILFTAVSAYPPFTFVNRLSTYHGHQFVPCTDKSCSYTKLIGTDHLKSTITLGSNWQDIFTVVKNGHQSTNKNIELSPICPNRSRDAMKRLCRSHATMRKVENTLGYGVSKIIFEICIFGWCLFKVIHDCCVMKDFTEFTTQRLGIISLAFQMCGVAAAFAWSMGAAAVFVAPLLEEGSCACYYRLPDVETLLAVANPLILFAFACNKLANVHRAAVSGDFLYFMSYDVPYHVTAQSLRDPTGSLLVSTIHGNYKLDMETPKGMQTLSAPQLRFLWALLHTGFDLLLFGGLVSFAAVAIGPTMVKMTDLAERMKFERCFAALLMVSPCLGVYAHMRTFISIRTGAPKLKESMLQWSRAYCIGMIALAVIEITFVTIATHVLVKLLFDRNHHQNNLKCAIAGMISLVFGLVRYVYNMIIMPPFCALSVIAKAPYNPSEYLEWADDYPEFDLGDKVEFATSFLNQEEQDMGRRSLWVPGWEKELDLPEVPWQNRRVCHGVGLRLNLIHQGCMWQRPHFQQKQSRSLEKVSL